MIEQATVEKVKALIGQTVDGGKQQVLTAWISGEDARLFVGRWYTVEEIRANGWIAEQSALTEADFEIGWWEIHWRDGKTSKAVVFRDNNDRLWLCCANWKGGSVRLSDCICQITEAYLVLTTDATE